VPRTKRQGDTAAIDVSEGVGNRARCVPIRLANSRVFVRPLVRPGAHTKQINNLPNIGAQFLKLLGPQQAYPVAIAS